MHEFHFRFGLHELDELAFALGLRQTEYRLENRGVVNRDTLLGIYLEYMAYPKRMGDMVRRYNRDAGTLSRARKKAFELLSPIVDDLSRLDRACYRQRLAEYGQAIEARGAPADNCIGFVDTTFLPFERPGRNQGYYYNGYYGGHGTKTLSVAFPDGMTGHSFGPSTARAGDGRIVRESGLEHEMNALCFRNGQWEYFIYGDWAFGLKP